MMKSLMLAAACALAPLCAAAQGIPVTVTTETMRELGTAITDAIRANQELIERERSQAARPAAASLPPRPEPQQEPQPVPAPTPR